MQTVEAPRRRQCTSKPPSSIQDAWSTHWRRLGALKTPTLGLTLNFDDQNTPSDGP